MNKYLALQKDVFDISKVTVVGSPTITSDGVASELDNTANILFPIKNEDLAGKSWSISGACLPVAGVGSRKVFAFGNNTEPSFGVIAYNEDFNRVDFQFKTGDTTSSSGIVYIRITLDSTPIKYVYFNLSFDRSSKTYTLKAKTETSSQWQEGNYVATTDNPDIYTLSNNPTNSLAIRAWANNTTTYCWSIPVDLKYYSVEIEGKEVYSPTKPTYLLERRKPMVWDKEQFTVVGSPSISESGIASGFSSGSTGNHIECIAVPQPTSSYEEHITFTTGSSFDLTTIQTIRGGTGIDGAGIRLYVNTKGYLCYRYGINQDGINKWANDSSSGILLQPNTTYNIKITWDGTQYKFYNNDVLIQTLNSIYPIYPVKLTLGNTYHNNWGTPFLNGSIDLKQFKIYTDGNLVFDGGADTYVYDSSKFTVIGSPTITEYGVASGFSGSDYITATTFNPSDKPWTISFNFKPNLLNDLQVLLSQFQNNIKVILTSGNKIILELDAGSWSSDRIIYHTFNETIVSNTDYNIKFGFTGSSYFAKLTNLNTNNGEEVNVVSAKILQEPSNNVLNLGVYKSSNTSTNILDPFWGSTDLPTFSITVDGKEVFTGAKEKYYMLNGI